MTCVFPFVGCFWLLKSNIILAVIHIAFCLLNEYKPKMVNLLVWILMVSKIYVCLFGDACLFSWGVAGSKCQQFASLKVDGTFHPRGEGGNHQYSHKICSSIHPSLPIKMSLKSFLFGAPLLRTHLWINIWLQIHHSLYSYNFEILAVRH